MYSNSSLLCWAEKYKMLVLFILVLLIGVAVFKELIYLLPKFSWRIFTPWVVLVFLMATLTLLGIRIAQRHYGLESINGVHDGITQTEIALSYLWQGTNPYSVDYFDTSLEEFRFYYNQVNPALYHYAYLPGVLVLGSPLYFISPFIIGFYDQRLTQALIFALLIFWLVWRYRQNPKLILLVPLLFFNFWFMVYFLHGLNDIVIIALVILALEFVIIRKYLASAIILGCALATKQTTWFVLPFLIQFFWHWEKLHFGTAKPEVRRRAIVWGGTALLVATIIILPFLIKDPQGFWADTISYQSGRVENSYPIMGIGMGEIIYQLGLVPERTSYFPFWIFQLIIAGLVGWYAWQYQKRRPIEPWLVLWLWTLLLTGVWFMNRYFSITHLAALIVMVCLTYFYKELEQGERFKTKPWFSRLVAGIIKK